MSVRTYTNKHTPDPYTRPVKLKMLILHTEMYVCVWLIIIDRYLSYVLVCIPEKVWNIDRDRESRMFHRTIHWSY